MTFSILTFDPKYKTFSGASVTGNICVGAWVLKADSRVGISASQGSEPSTIWGEDVLELINTGVTAKKAVDIISYQDPKRNFRQLSAIDNSGNPGIFNGNLNELIIDYHVEKNIVISGNTLKNKNVIPAMLAGFKNEEGNTSRKLIKALEKGHEAGGDTRGINSAAILVVGNSRTPLDLRVDDSKNPIKELNNLYNKTCDQHYSQWMKRLPTRSNL